jgi:Uri superfamily endonuclease
MHPLPGTYALIFSAYRKSQLKIGKLGTLQLKPGFYVYIGSAFGAKSIPASITTTGFFSKNFLTNFHLVIITNLDKAQVLV